MENDNLGGRSSIKKENPSKSQEEAKWCNLFAKISRRTVKCGIWCMPLGTSRTLGDNKIRIVFQLLEWWHIGGIPTTKVKDRTLLLINIPNLLTGATKIHLINDMNCHYTMCACVCRHECWSFLCIIDDHLLPSLEKDWCLPLY